MRKRCLKWKQVGYIMYKSIHMFVSHVGYIMYKSIHMFVSITSDVRTGIKIDFSILLMAGKENPLLFFGLFSFYSVKRKKGRIERGTWQPKTFYKDQDPTFVSPVMVPDIYNIKSHSGKTKSKITKLVVKITRVILFILHVFHDSNPYGHLILMQK